MNRELDRGELQDRLPDLVHGTLPEAERAAVENAVATDPGLARELDVVRQAHAALTPRVPAIDTNRVVAAIRHPAPVRRFGGVARWRIAAAIATLVVGGASLTVVQRVRGTAGDTLTITGESLLVASAESPSIAFGYDLSELPAEDLEQLIAELEKTGGVPSAEPRPNVVIPPVEDPR